MLYMVTVTVEGTVGHNPLSKVSGPCPVTGKRCTDVTGKHHTFLVSARVGADEVRDIYAKTHHVTRVEAVATVDVLGDGDAVIDRGDVR